VGEPAQPSAAETLPTRVKAGYALGDHAINVQLAATSLFYLFFLTEVAGLRPSLAWWTPSPTPPWAASPIAPSCAGAGGGPTS
jgi:hypothetical protein